VLAACFGAHFLLIVVVCLATTLSIFARTPTIFPDSLQSYWRKGGELGVASLGRQLSQSNPIRNTITIYLHVAGSEGGYGFFAPNVPDSFTLLFEIHFADERVEYDLPHVRSDTSGLRFSGLLDEISMTTYEPLRETIFKILTYSVWQSYPDASRIRAIFTAAMLPSTTEFEAGRETSHQILYAYELSFPDQTTESRH
jgi:hypothetical protein